VDERALIVGAVATAPDSVALWEGIRAHFLEVGSPMDYTLYSNHDRLTEQLMDGDVDVAWLSPLAFVRARRRAGGMVMPLVVGDTDRDVRSHVVMRRLETPFTLGALEGMTLAVGSRDSASSRVLPLFFLRQAGVDLSAVRVLPMEVDVGKGGQTGRADREVLQVVREGRASAGVVTDRAWREAENTPASDGLRVVWSSPTYDGAVFASMSSVPTGLRTSFEHGIRSMHAADPRHRAVLERVGVSGWVPARESGYSTLRQAVEELTW
jgi:ABC-type phosphate/phosphonate transport system substrate-binding protein